ncbi:hypothetical protein ALC57_08359 [Trachymyrmex cornetzi]|uniref:Uncharacterized protein n=1 Tax=Trachymyrmex cornetzi TaxID=471704 RepID=A0A151J719_9HYME|nr:hypothetical protein ALC57_08359 [Trachymyrmex cornetzi]
MCYCLQLDCLHTLFPTAHKPPTQNEDYLTPTNSLVRVRFFWKNIPSGHCLLIPHCSCANGSVRNRVGVQTGPCAIGSCAIGSACKWVCVQTGLCAIEVVCNRVMRNRVRAQSDPCPIRKSCRVRLLMCAIGPDSLYSQKKKFVGQFEASHEFPKKVIACLVRTRTYIRLGRLIKK